VLVCALKGKLTKHAHVSQIDRLVAVVGGRRSGPDVDPDAGRQLARA
jgi:hypothetical protein